MLDDSASNKVLTTENSAKKGIQVSSRCVLCKNDGETSKHLFQIFPLSHDLWLHAIGKIGYLEPIPST